jgi:hypothetical protein
MRISFLFALLFIRIFVTPAQPLRPEAADYRLKAMTDSLVNPELVRLGKLYKLDSSSLAAYDKIITFDRQVFVGRIINISFSEVRFTHPHDKAIQNMSRSRVSQILYADGRRDLFIALDDANVIQKEYVDTGRIIVKGQKDWMKVIVTENPGDVNNLMALGEIKTRYEAETGSMDNKELMRRAAITLRKKAAAMNAHCVLVETKFFRKPYGELPVVDITARLFGYKE